MKARWRITLPLCGLVLFAIVTRQSIVEKRRLVHNDGRYFSWSYICLNSDPLNKHWKEPALCSCSHSGKDCFVDPMDVWTEPGLLVRVLILAALPAFLAGFGILLGLGRLGLSEIVTFMVSIPLLITAWFYLVGWLLDRRRNPRRG